MLLYIIHCIPYINLLTVVHMTVFTVPTLYRYSCIITMYDLEIFHLHVHVVDWTEMANYLGKWWVITSLDS